MYSHSLHQSYCFCLLLSLPRMILSKVCLMSGCLVTLLPGSLWCSRAKAERRRREREGGGGNKAGRRSGGSRQEAAARPNTEEMRRGGSENEEGASHVRRLPLNLILTPSPSLQAMAWMRPESACVKGEKIPGSPPLHCTFCLLTFLKLILNLLNSSTESC